MLVVRWQAPMVPTKEQVKMMLEFEGLEPYEEVLSVDDKITEHRHPFDEVRMVLEGEVFFNVAGNQLLLRAGDKIEIPANTRHSHECRGTSSCVCICAQRPF